MIREIKIRYVLMLAACILFISAVSSNAAAQDTKDSEKPGSRVVARVNGEPLYEGQLLPYVKREMKKFSKYAGNRDVSELKKRINMKALDEVITQELIKQESRKLQVKNMDEKINEKLKEFRDKYETEEKFKGFLTAKGLTEKDLKESMKNRIYLEEYYESKGLKDPKVPDEEIREYYDDNAEGFRREKFIKASHILILVKEDAGPDEKEELRAKAEKIRKEILEGADFAEAAKKYSEDGKASVGGDLGYINRGYMPSEFDDAAFSLDNGALSEVVFTKYGYHIIKVLDMKPAGIAPYEEVKDFIGRYLQEGLARRNLISHTKELKARAEIEILLNRS